MLKNLDMGAAMRRLAERKIEEAMQQGKFDNLEGAGQPLELEPMPADENARMLWWAIRILRQNDVVPDEIRYRKAIALFRQRLPDVSSEAEVRTIVEQANAIIRKLNTMGTNVIPNQTTLIDVDEELQRWRDRRSPTSPLVIRRPPS